MIKRSLQLMICAAMMVFGGVPSALARPTRIAMTKVSGDANGVGRAVAEAIDDGSLVIVPAQRVARALERLKLDDQQLATGDISRLADELEVDAVIRGAYDRKTRKMRFTIFAGGKKGKPFAVVVRNPQSTKFRTLVHDTVMTRLATMVSESSKRRLSAPAKDDPAPSPSTKLMADPPVRDDPAPPTKLMADPPDTGLRKLSSAREPADAETVTVAAVDHGPRSANLAVARADLGLSVMARNLQFDATGNGPPRYRNGPVPGARFEGEVYPFALNDASSSLAGLGIAADIDQTIGLSVPDAAGNRLKTTERHYAIGVRYRIAFGDTPTSTTLTLGAGYAARQFAIDRASSMLDVPDVGYQLVDPGAALRLPLGPRFAVTLAGRGLIALSAGAIQRSDQYGGTQLYGATASAGLEVRFGDSIVLRVAGEATELLLKFSGNGALANRDADASTIEVRGATDRYLGGAATLAIVY